MFPRRMKMSSLELFLDVTSSSEPQPGEQWSPVERGSCQTT